MCTAEVLGGSPEGLSLWQRTDLRTVWDPQKAGWIHALGMADAQGSQLLFFLPRAVDEAIPEAMRGRVLSWNVQRGEEGRVLFFWLQGVVLIRRWGSDFFFCWIILLVLRSCWLGGAANCGRHGGRCAFARRSHVAALVGRCAWRTVSLRRAAAPPHVLRVKGFALYTAEPESAMAVGRLA